MLTGKHYYYGQKQLALSGHSIGRSYKCIKEHICCPNTTYSHHRSAANTNTVYLLAETIYSISSLSIQHIRLAEWQLAPRDLEFESPTDRPPYWL